MFHTLTWISKRAKCLIKSFSSADVDGTSATAGESFLLKSAYCKLLGAYVWLSVNFDTKSLNETISTKRLPTDKAIKGDLASLRYDLEAIQIKQIIRVPGKLNLADPMTKVDNPIEKCLRDTLPSGALCTYMSSTLVNYAKETIWITWFI